MNDYLGGLYRDTLEKITDRGPLNVALAAAGFGVIAASAGFGAALGATLLCVGIVRER